MPEQKWTPTVCWGCIEGWCAVRVHVIDGVAVNIEGDTAGPAFDTLSKNQGKVCPKVFGLIQKLYNPHRIRGPLKRTNPQKGRGVNPEWVEISWDEALDIVAERLKEVRSKNTMQLFRLAGTQQARGMMGTWDMFFQAYGPTFRMLGGASIRCDMAEHVFGNIIHGGFHCEPDLTHCNYLMLLSENPSASGGAPANSQFIDARTRGMKTVVVDPVFSLTAAKADEWLPIRPGTDSAFLLAVINVIVNEMGTCDWEFLKEMTAAPYLVDGQGHFHRDGVANKPLIWDRADNRAKTFDDSSIKDPALEGAYSVGGLELRPAFQKLKEHVCQYSPEWAARVTDIPADTIRRIAREWVENARIGSTIELDGLTLPYRPVATKMGRAITGSMHGYQTVLANHILAAIVGALEVPGGHCGGRWKPVESNHGIVPGPDGMPAVEKYGFIWPPVSFDGRETLLPYSKYHGHLSHLAFLNMADPSKGFHMPLPEVFFHYRCNPLLSIGESAPIEKGLEHVPFTVSVGYVLDEMSDYADIILPEHTELERFEMMPEVRRSAAARRFRGTLLRQPVVKPLYDTRDISDILTELADRIGFLAEYNDAINKILGLAVPDRLAPDKKYAWVDIVDRQCKSHTGGAHDLKWFQENGGYFKPVSAGEHYDVYLGMKEKKLRYQLPYLEDVKRTGEDLAQNLSRVGVDWWPTAEYVALPVYVPPIFEKQGTDFDFYVTTSKSMQFSWGANVDIPWLIELGRQVDGHDYIVMNAGAAALRGIKAGDEVWVESEVGKVKGRVRLAQGIRPDTIAIAGQFGHWAMPVARDSGRTSQTPLLPIRYDWTDTLVGCMQGQVVKARVYKD